MVAVDQATRSASALVQRGIEIPEGCNPDLGFISVTEKDVLNVLQSVSANKSSGPDNLSPIILKCFSNYLAPPNTYEAPEATFALLLLFS